MFAGGEWGGGGEPMRGGGGVMRTPLKWCRCGWG